MDIENGSWGEFRALEADSGRTWRVNCPHIDLARLTRHVIQVPRQSLGTGRQKSNPPQGSGFQKSTTILGYSLFSFIPLDTLAWLPLEVRKVRIRMWGCRICASHGRLTRHVSVGSDHGGVYIDIYVHICLMRRPSFLEQSSHAACIR